MSDRNVRFVEAACTVPPQASNAREVHCARPHAFCTSSILSVIGRLFAAKRNAVESIASILVVGRWLHSESPLQVQAEQHFIRKAGCGNRGYVNFLGEFPVVGKTSNHYEACGASSCHGRVTMVETLSGPPAFSNYGIRPSYPLVTCVKDSWLQCLA